MRGPKFSNEKDLLEAFAAGGKMREDAIRYLCLQKSWERIALAIVRQDRGSRNDALELFNKSILTLMLKLDDKAYTGEGKLEAYFRAIANNEYRNMRKIRRNYARRFQPIEAKNESVAASESYENLATESHQRVVQQLLDRTGERCKHLLLLFYQGYSMEDIAQETGLENAGRARRAKYECFQRFKKLVMEDGDLLTYVKNLLQ